MIKLVLSILGGKPELTASAIECMLRLVLSASVREHIVTIITYVRIRAKRLGHIRRRIALKAARPAIRPSPRPSRAARRTQTKKGDPPALGHLARARIFGRNRRRMRPAAVMGSIRLRPK
jgi:hypothetical protein